MAAKAVKQAVEITTQPELLTSEAIAFDLEEQIADELLNNIDWAKVRSVCSKKRPLNFSHGSLVATIHP